MLPRTKIMVFLLIVSSIVLLSRPLTLVNAKNVEITENPSLKENFQLVDRESFNSEFETILNQSVRFNLTTQSNKNSEVRLLVEDASGAGVYDDKANAFDLLFTPNSTPNINNAGKWKYWVENPGTFPGGDPIDVQIEIFLNTDPIKYYLDHPVSVSLSSQTESVDTTDTAEETSDDKSEAYPNELSDVVSFPFHWDLGTNGYVNTTLRMTAGIKPTEIYDLSGRDPLNISVSVGKFLSSANADLDNLSLFGLNLGFLERGSIVPFYTPFTNASITLLSLGTVKFVLLFNITYVVEFNLTKGNGNLSHTYLEFKEPSAKNITLEFTGSPRSGDQFIINVTWKAVIKAQIVLFGTILGDPFEWKNRDPQNVTGLETAFDVEIDKSESVTGFEFLSLLLIGTIIVIYRKRKLH